ncbi:MAG: DUF4127 family protein [Ruminococcaceae bacterium]|nr:DUF4127 family protein [Oscillospiraceae bacterium]
MKRFVCFALAVIMLTALFPCFVTDTAYALEKRDYNGLQVAYIPIDNRPVNYDRVKMLAKSVGFELLMPEEDTFRTALDNMKPNKNGSTYGDREKLLNWLKETDKTCDYFVLSLDQLLSGGLVASRWLDNTDLTFEFEVADYIINLAKNNTVVLFDTVMRLASTVNYQGYQMPEYNNLRSYGSVARLTLTGSELTVDNIIAGYKYGENGKKISTPLSDMAVDKYLASRTRKLKLIDYILSKSLEDLEYCYIGVDDSSTTTNIQTNEINLISNKLGDNGVIYAGTDELGLMGITRIVTKLYGSPKVGVTYFGNSKDQIADEFDFASLEYEINNHIKSLGCTVVDGDKGDVEVLVITKNSGNDQAIKLVDKAFELVENKKPVIIIDPNSKNADFLQKQLLTREFPLSMLLGYSNWNTAANAMGIALSNGISRYTYLANCSNITRQSHRGFLEASTFGFLKDISYKYYGFSIENPGVSAYGSYASIVKQINGSEMITSLSPYTVSKHETVSVSNFRYPWERTFEMTFDVKVAVTDSGIKGDVNDDGRIILNDYLMSKRIEAGTKTADIDMLARADINGDGKINKADYVQIKKRILGD